LCFDILCYLTDRRDGKPFTAINPATTEVPHTINQDNRLQIAIQQMLPASAKVSKGAKTLQAQPVELQQASALANVGRQA
jgi:hypothetical protein